MPTSAQIARLKAEVGELILRQRSRGAARRDLRRFTGKPVAFITRALKAPLWSKQRAMVESVLTNRFTAVYGCNSAGKDYTLARLALYWAYVVRGLVLIVAPTARQAEEILMRKEVARALISSGLDATLRVDTLRLPGAREASILAATSNDVSKLTGHHHANGVLAIISEAQGVDETVFEAMLACATGARDRVIAVGNPLAPEGPLHRITRPRSQWAKVHISAFDHPNISEAEAPIPGGPTPEWVESQRREYGADDPRYVSRVLGDFPETSEHGLLRRAWLDAAVERHESQAFAQSDLGASWCAGVDPAGSENGDATAFALRRGATLHALETWHESDTMKSAGIVSAQLQARRLAPAPREDRDPFITSDEPRYGPGIASPDVSLVVDVVGLGKGLADRLVEQGWTVDLFHASSKPRAKLEARFLNRRVEVYWKLRELFEAGAIAIPRDEQLIEELLATEYRIIDSSGKLALVPKDELRQRLGRSPDRADALAYCFGTADATTGGGDMIDL